MIFGSMKVVPVTKVARTRPGQSEHHLKKTSMAKGMRKIVSWPFDGLALSDYS